MGSRLSRQEVLFTSLEWSQLLEESLEEQVQRKQRELVPLPPTNSTTTDDRRGGNSNNQEGFQLSYVEWQAFLGSLEEERNPKSGEVLFNTAGPTELCSQRIQKESLNEPLVVLTVHAIAWVKGVLASLQENSETKGDALLFDKCEGLLEVMQGISWQTPPESEGEEENEKEKEDEECVTAQEVHHGTQRQQQQHITTQNQKGSKRKMLWKSAVSLKNRVQQWNRSSSSDPSKHKRSGIIFSSSSCPDSNVWSEVLGLYDLLLTIRKHHREEKEKNNGEHAGLKENESEKEFRTLLFSIYRGVCSTEKETSTTSTAEKKDPESLRERPVLILCVYLLLLIAAVQYPQPTFVEFAQSQVLTQLAQTVQSWRRSYRKEEGERMEENVTEKIWPLLRFLNQKLLRGQYELDAVTEVKEAKTGTSYQGKLLSFSQHQVEFSATLHDALAGREEAIWNYQREQYVGQPHVWRTVQSIFLNGAVFEKRKPNVLLFFGPSGYGKSELARRIATALHGFPPSQESSLPSLPIDVEAEGKLVFIHMPSFCTRDSIYSLVDPPAAHVGMSAVVVLDEFEKSTADSIQNLWLSAFQKNGTLRSLKQKDRFVSTNETTFVLTCNLCDELIKEEEQAFLDDSHSGKEKRLQRYVQQCKEKCISLFGEPFVNRVDYFLPFVPYSKAEKEQFVLLQLEHVLRYQRVHHKRNIYLTHRFVDAMVSVLRSFHSNVVEEILKPLIVHMNTQQWQSAVLTADSLYLASPDSVPEPALTGAFEMELPTNNSKKGSEVRVRFVLVPTTRPPDGEKKKDQSSESSLYWSDLSYGEECLLLWETEKEVKKEEKQQQQQEKDRSVVVEDVTVNANERYSNTPRRGKEGTTLPTGGGGGGGSGSVGTEKILELETEKDLQYQLEVARETIRQKDIEIETLKEKVLILEKLVALLTCMLLSCFLFIAFIIGLKLALLLLMTFLLMAHLLFGISLSLLVNALVSFSSF